MRSFLTLILVISLSTFTVAQSTDGCTQQGAWNSTGFDAMVQDLASRQNSITRQELLNTYLASSSQGLNSSEIVTILKLFENAITQKEIIKQHASKFLGLYCKDVVEVCRLFPNELLRLDILPSLVNLTIDLSKNNESIIDTFMNTFNKRDAKKIIDDAKPISCIWGDVSAKRLIFVVDTSGSMSTTFKDGITGKTYTRLQYVALQLDQVIRSSLASDQEFNVISFSSSSSAWKPGVVPVNAANIDTAVSFVDKLIPSGSTAMLNALNLAFSDPKAVAVYLLSDGQPDGSTATIIQAATKWSANNGGDIRRVNTVAFQAGGTFDTKAAEFMLKLATATQGVYRSVV